MSIEIDTRNSFIIDSSDTSSNSFSNISDNDIHTLNFVNIAASIDDVNGIAEEIVDGESANEQDDVNTALKNVRIKNRNGLIIAYSNINSIRNKIDFLRPMISESIDALIIAETKIDNTFPTSQFVIEGYIKPFRYDRNQNGGGLLIYVRERAPMKALTQYKTPDDLECGMIEINLKNKKWLLVAIYRPPSQTKQYFFDEISKMLDHYCRQYENFILIGDFNCEIGDDVINDFVDSYELASLVRSQTCFKSDSPRCIDLVLTNTKSSFQATTTIETGLSDFHTMIVTVLKGGHVKRGPKVISYWDYSRFSAVDFRTHLIHMLSSELGGNEDYGAFKAVVMTVLNEHTPVKKKYIRANDGPFMTKALRKENMHRTILRNKYKRQI